MEDGANTYQVRLRDKGQVTIPRGVRETINAQEGDILSLLQIDDLILITPKVTRLSALTEQFTAEMDRAGVSLADLLEGLADARAEIARERRERDA
ncbi:MAG TPA: AbrB/MazE/SpoVT family DNA-binding domain-containing protein [Anaerolineales bacterium]|nr:AbrB/MazE/SpoVT family DNA-binding domain-containing protein [Anaerolineales bacterium]